MLNKFWESIGSNAAERWLDYIFSPALLFWAGGLGLYAWETDWQALLNALQALTPVQQAGWILLALLILVISAVLMQAIRFPILRLLEGYWPWPFNFLGMGVVALQKYFFRKKLTELRHLMNAGAEMEKPDARQREKQIELDHWAHWHPVNAEDLLPTGLGNILRARERAPERKYGLDAVICWPRLWPLLPENMRTDLSNARSALDRLAELCFWGFLFLIWKVWTPWALVIGLVWAVMSYGMACRVAMAYGDLLETAFDLHRFSLYHAMYWPRPKNTQEEKKLGVQLTEYLWRGTLSEPFITYQSREE